MVRNKAARALPLLLVWLGHDGGPAPAAAEVALQRGGAKLGADVGDDAGGRQLQPRVLRREVLSTGAVVEVEGQISSLQGDEEAPPSGALAEAEGGRHRRPRRRGRKVRRKSKKAKAAKKSKPGKGSRRKSRRKKTAQVAKRGAAAASKQRSNKGAGGAAATKGSVSSKSKRKGKGGRAAAKSQRKAAKKGRKVAPKAGKAAKSRQKGKGKTAAKHKAGRKGRKAAKTPRKGRGKGKGRRAANRKVSKKPKKHKRMRSKANAGAAAAKHKPAESPTGEEEDLESHEGKAVHRHRQASKGSPPLCEWAEWSAWTNCSSRCGLAGERMRVRVQRAAANAAGQPACDAKPQTQKADCKPKPCPVNCKWGEWTTWTACSRNCDTGNQSRHRHKTPRSHGGADCKGGWAEYRACNKQSCAAQSQQQQQQQQQPQQPQQQGGVPAAPAKVGTPIERIGGGLLDELPS